MPDHVWTDNPDGTITCTLCGLTRGLAFGKHKPRGLCRKAKADGTAAPAVARAPCGTCNPPAQDKPLPSLARRAANFAGAALRDRMNGRKRRTLEQVARLFHAHCNGCDEYNRRLGACTDCGCPVNLSVSPDLDNKLAAAAEVCPQQKWPYPAIERRNLLFYLLPLRHSLKIWQWHVEQLRKYLPLFNGRKIITVATHGENNKLAIESIEDVREAFGEDAALVEFLERPNDPEHWETPAFREMLEMVESLDPTEATFYFHAKGVRRAKQEAIRPWCQEIYRHNLGRLDDAMEALRYWNCCGVARSETDPVAMTEGGGHWHFAGTGFWFRHHALFSRPTWSKIINHSHAVEAYLSTQFSIDESYCLAHDNVGSVYDAGYWRSAIAATDARLDVEQAIDPADVRVSLLVVGRNYGRYLAECLESCAWQTHKPHEILYVDDASEDDSVAIASDLWTSGKLRPFRVVGLDKRIGAAAARNHAAALATGNALVFVDADDVLPADYLARCVARLGVSTPFVYTDMQCFGRENRLVRMPEWGAAELRKQNFCHSSSLIWREAFEAAGGWTEGDFGHMADWHLFLRLATLGDPRRADVALGYRRHGQSWTDTALASDPQAIEAARERILASVDAWAAERKVSSSKFHSKRGARRCKRLTAAREFS